MSRLLRRISGLLASFAFVCSPLVVAADDDVAGQQSSPANSIVRFNRDVRPILSDKCFACHGPDAETVEGGLRLDLDAEAKADGSAIVPGNAADSELIRRIASDDEDEVMPPTELHKPVTPAELQTLRHWIDQGAVYEPHWAYTPLPDPSPETDDEEINPIDRAINHRLMVEGVTAVQSADPVTLIRRLSFDLTGLPPTPAEVDAFLNDKSADRYQRLVNRLLDSPRFGERMAVYWLDLVRYADTVGYHGDQNVSQSPYRDYVIEAFNSGMPYDRFITEQLAGDLLPDATLSQRIASGYNRLNQTTEEGGSQAKEYLAIYFADRVRNVSQVFMGATVGCAQCHDHKYDPYTARDFYSLGAFFADLDERGVYSARERPPTIQILAPAEQDAIDAIKVEADAATADLEQLRQQILVSQVDWERQVRDRVVDAPQENAWLDELKPKKGNISGDWNFVDATNGPVHAGKTSRRQQSDQLIQHFVDDSDSTVTVAADTSFYAWVFLDPEQPPKAIMVQVNNGDWSHRRVWGDDSISYGLRPKSWDGYRRAGKLPETGAWVRLEVAASDVGLKLGDSVKGIAFTQFGGLVHWDDAGWIATNEMPANIAETLTLPVDKRSDEQAAALTEFYLESSEPLKQGAAAIDTINAKADAIRNAATTMVVSRAVKPRTIRILHRGNWMDDSGEIVQPAVPEFLGELQTGDRTATRLDLARWLSRPDNPLTSRTMVNRLWSLMFGRGICASVDDLGGQGSFPSYPDLLDRLAVEFVESGWDIKASLRSIVTSDAYRRSSRPTAELRELDPYNDLFARQGRFRIDAESVRDAALLASGLLIEKIGGKSVHPYQPAGYYAQLNFPRRTYKPDAGDDQYRRGVYTHWQRTFLHPMLKAFDAPSREECTASRARSNTPLQALTLLNDPTFVEAATAFAARIVAEGGESTEQRVSWAYRVAVSQAPDDAIARELMAVYETHHAYYLQNPEQSKALTEQFSDAMTIDEADDAGRSEFAAWVSVARVVLNLHETITRY